MNELTPTTKAERDGFIADTQPDEYLFVKRLIADIDRADAILKRSVLARIMEVVRALEPIERGLRLDIVRDRALIERVSVCGVGRLARRTGLSRSTIGRWLGGGYPVRAATREAILRAADEIGPRPRSATDNAARCRAYYRANKRRWETYKARREREQRQRQEAA